MHLLPQVLIPYSAQDKSLLVQPLELLGKVPATPQLGGCDQEGCGRLEKGFIRGKKGTTRFFRVPNLPRLAVSPNSGWWKPPSIYPHPKSISTSA